MIVVRLNAWLLRMLASLTTSWRTGAPMTAGANADMGERTLVAASVVPYRSGLASGSWLDDARRLRARPLTRLGSAAPSREHIQQILHDPRWAAAYNAAQTEHFPRTASTPEPRETERHVRHGESASRPLTSSARQEDGENRESPSMSSLRERRRLVYVRELVRRGIYNEGFTPGLLPDQYRSHPDGDSGPLPLDE
jgi:hypothetical protein